MSVPLKVVAVRRPSARLVVTLAAATVLAATLPRAGQRWPVQSGFAPAFGAATIIGYLLTAYLIFARYRADGRARMLPLAGTYLFAGLIVVPHMLTYPDLFSETGYLGAHAATATWFWVVWHAGIPIGLLATFLPRAEHMPRFQRRARAIIAGAGGVALIVVAMSLLILCAGDRLPPVMQANSYAPLRHTAGPEVLALGALALALVAWRTRTPDDPIERWMIVVAVEAFADVLLTLWAGRPASAGWYVAQINSLCAAYVVLLAMMLELGRMYSRLAQAHDQLARVAYRDALTGLYNRRALDERLAQEVARAGRYDGGFALLMLDIDHFKTINDTQGHSAGDRVLHDVAQTITGCTRRSDWAARYGGEEFVVLLPETDLDGAAQLAERIRAAVATMSLAAAGAARATVTVSIGVAACPASGATAHTVLASVDRALYAAKSGGRNRVVCDAVALVPTAA